MQLRERVSTKPEEIIFTSEKDMPPLVISLGTVAFNKTGTWRSVRPIYEEKLPPCNHSCPAGTDVRGFLDLVAKGKILDAWNLINNTNPLPGTCGKVCPHPCEQSCNRGKFDEALSIREVERFLGEEAIKNGWLLRRIADDKDEKIGIIGAGPSGLSCGYQLARRGYKVTIFDALPKPGGMMLSGIPEYRLPRRILNSEIERIKNVGVEIKTNTPIKSLDYLFKEGYQAIFLGLGAHQGLKLGIEGEDLPCVVDSVEFLRHANLGEKVNVGERVGVIGGGNVAIDAARMSLRLGAKKVTIFYRRSRAEMPAYPEEIEDAIKEGVEIVYLAAPSKVIRDNNTLKLECARMQLGEPDASGRPRPMPVKGSEFITELDTLLVAIGQQPEVSTELGVEFDRGNLIKVDTEMKTSREAVFAGGDSVTQPATVAQAIAAGNQAAMSIDSYLQGRLLALPAKPAHVLDFQELNLNYVKHQARLNQINDTTIAVEEAKRCLSCGHCNLCGNCWLFCPDIAVKLVNEHYEIDYDYCKGCGICSHECPCSFISMVEEGR